MTENPSLDPAAQAQILQVLNQFCGGQPELLAKELQMIRVIEDLVGVMISKGLLQATDLPQAVQMKLLERKSMREQGQLGSVNPSGLIRL